MSHLLSPSILAADFLRLEDEIEMLNRSEADWIHCDVMDGLFVPNISFGIPVIKAVHRVAQKPLDVHLMIQSPDRYVKDFAEAGASVLTVHAEACLHLDRTLHMVRENGMRPGVAINPATPIDGLKHILPLADMVLIMTVNPGFGGQAFIPYTLDKIRELRQMIRDMGLATRIEVDGGVDMKTAPLLIESGADVLVSGSFVFGAPDPIRVINDLKKAEPGLRIA